MRTSEDPPWVPALATYEADPRRLVTTFWRIGGPRQRTMTCALYRTGAGLELRAGYDPNSVFALRTMGVVSEQAAAIVAGHWKVAALAVGSFLDLDAPA